MLMTLCLEKSSKDSNKIYQLFARIPISENISKYDISDSKEDTYRGVSLKQIWMLQAKGFSKKPPPKFLFRSLENFFKIDIKNSSW